MNNEKTHVMIFSRFKLINNIMVEWSTLNDPPATSSYTLGLDYDILEGPEKNDNV